MSLRIEKKLDYPLNTDLLSASGIVRGGTRHVFLRPRSLGKVPEPQQSHGRQSPVLAGQTSARAASFKETHGAAA